MSFFDFYEDGHLDIMGTRCASEESVRVGKIIPILNSLNIDAFFMKITVLSNIGNEKVK